MLYERVLNILFVVHSALFKDYSSWYQTSKPSTWQ